MRIFFTTAVLIVASITSALAQNYVYDFVPQIEKEFFRMIYDEEEQREVPEAVIQVRFDENVYWVSGYPSQCYVLDASGEKVTGWKPDFSGPSDNYTLLYLGVMGLSQYVDANYTLVIPQGVLGNPLWNVDGDGGRSNPELRFDFNVWELAGRPGTSVGTTATDHIDNAPLYNLHGMKVDGSSLTKGIYVRNGRKIIVR